MKESFFDRYPDAHEPAKKSEISIKEQQSLEKSYVNRSFETKSREKLEYVHIGPENYKEEVSIMYLKGFSTNNIASKDFIGGLTDKKTSVFAINNPHGIGSGSITETQKQAASEKFGALPEIELRKTAAVQELVKHEEIKRIDIVAHSEGAIYAIIYALMNPGKVRNIILIDPAGMVGEDNRYELIKRATKDTLLQTEKIRQKLLGIDPRVGKNADNPKKPISLRIEGHQENALAKSQAKEFIGALADNPKRWTEAIGAIANADIVEALQYLRHDCGIKVGIIHAVDDQTFPIDRIRKNSKDAMDGSFSTVGTHCTFDQNPDKYIQMVKDLISGMEMQREKGQLDDFL